MDGDPMIGDEVGAYTRVTVLAYGKFESVSLQQRVRLSCNFIFAVKNLGFPRGFPGCIPGVVGREAQGPPTSRQPGAISLSGHIPVPHFRRCGRDEPLC
jgi:hypothetical protein